MNDRNERRSKKSLGQNFLVDPHYQKKIIEAVKQDYQGEPILEIGPGRGAITTLLSPFATQLVAVEKDDDLAAKLESKFLGMPRMTVVTADFLKTGIPAGLLSFPAIVVANLPYNVATKILTTLLPQGPFYKRLYLMLQKEVGERCLARPGTGQYGLLRAWVEVFATATQLFEVPATAFSPRPRVVSCFLCFELKQQPDPQDMAFLDFVKLLFGQRRKKVGTILKKRLRNTGPLADSSKAVLEKRTEELGITELRLLFDSLCKTGL